MLFIRGIYLLFSHLTTSHTTVRSARHTAVSCFYTLQWTWHQPRVDELRDLHLNGNSVMNVVRLLIPNWGSYTIFFDNYSFFFVEKFCSLRFFCTFAQSLCCRCFIAKSQKAPLQVIFRRDAIFGKGVYHTLVLWHLESPKSFQILPRVTATKGSHGYDLVGGYSCPFWQDGQFIGFINVERVTIKSPHFSILVVY